MNKLSYICTEEDGYFSILLGIVHPVRPYRKLLLLLDSIAYKWILPMDKNRGMDGVTYRYRVISNAKLQVPLFRVQRDCSVLEMLIALADRCESEYSGSPGDDHPERIFWLMLHNLQLDIFDDNSYDKERIEEIVARWLSRDYDEHGFGGLFPLETAMEDQRYVEIWQQMLEYVFANRLYYA